MEDINSPLDLFKWDFKNYIDGKHLHVMNKRLVKFVDGDIENLAFFLPPRHSKSMMTSVYLPAYWMIKNPDITIIQTGHSKNLVEQFTMHSRDIVAELSDYPLNDSMQRMNEYKYARPYTGHVKGIGIGGGITGFGAKVLIIDDIIKGAEESLNPSARKKLEDYYSGSLSTRLMPKGQKLLTMTRWHSEDIATKILEDGDDSWEIIKLPAICEDETQPVEKELGRKEGAALWPEFWPLEELMKRKKSVGNYFWNAEYLQNPIPQEGNLLNPQSIMFYTRAPAPRGERTRIMAVDLAISEASRADETAVTILDVIGNTYYLEAQYAWRKNTDYTEHELSKLYNYWSPDSFYMESIGFQEVVRQNLLKKGIPVLPLIDRRNKEVKISELAPHLDNGRIMFKNPVAQWDDLINQIAAFPLHPHDDRVESLWMAIKMAEKAGNPYTRWDGTNAYDFSPAGLHKPNSRPQSVIFDRNNNPYSTSRS